MTVSKGVLVWIAKKLTAETGRTHLPHEKHVPANVTWKWECQKIAKLEGFYDIDLLPINRIGFGDSRIERFTRTANASWKHPNAKMARLSTYFFEADNEVFEAVWIYGIDPFAVHRGWADETKHLLSLDGVEKRNGVLTIDMNRAGLRGKSLENVGPVVVTGNVGAGISIRSSGANSAENTPWARDMIRRQRNLQTALQTQVAEAQRKAVEDRERNRPHSVEYDLFVNRAREVINTLDGNFDPMDRGVKFSDLIDNGLASVTIENETFPASVNPYPSIKIAGTGATTIDSIEAPTVPSGLAATGMVRAVRLTWNAPGFAGYSYSAVYRAESDNLAQATLVGASQVAAYVDNLDDYGTHYYWVRHINRLGVESALSTSVAGDVGKIGGQQMAPLIATADKLATLDLSDPAVTGQLTGIYFAAEILTAETAALGTAAIRRANIASASIGLAHFLRTGPDAFKVKNIHMPAGANAVLQSYHIGNGVIKDAWFDRLSANKIKIGSAHVAPGFTIQNAKIGDLSVGMLQMTDMAGYSARVIAPGWANPYGLNLDTQDVPVGPFVFGMDENGNPTPARGLLFIKVVVDEMILGTDVNISSANNFEVKLPIDSEGSYKTLRMSDYVRVDSNDGGYTYYVVAFESPTFMMPLFIDPVANWLGSFPNPGQKYNFNIGIKPLNWATSFSPVKWHAEVKFIGLLK